MKYLKKNGCNSVDAKNLKDPALIRSLLFLETNFLKDLLFTRYQAFPVQTGFFYDGIPEDIGFESSPDCVSC